MKTSDQESDKQRQPSTIEALAGKVPTVLQALGTPLKFFGLVAMLCLPVFSLAAANVRDKLSYDAFIYTLHTYLAVVGMFALISLFSPRSLYHPKEIQDLHNQGLLPKHHPIIPCIIALASLAMYLLYQALVVYKVADHGGGTPTVTTNAPGVIVSPR